jgi:hypothetical protein
MNLLMLGDDMNVVDRLVDVVKYAYVTEIWPMNERSGSVLTGAVKGLNGTYSGVTVADTAGRVPGSMAPYFDGVNDTGNIYSAGLNASFNPLAGTMAILYKAGGSVLTDGLTQHMFDIRVNTSNLIAIYQVPTNNTFALSYRAGGAGITTANIVHSSAAWNLIGFTWDRGLDEFRPYLNASQNGSTLTMTGTWAGALASNFCTIGSYGTTPSNVWIGHESYAMLFNRAVSAAEWARINRILGG